MANLTRKFEVILSPSEREALEALCRRQSVGAAKQRRARILLLSDAAHPDGGRTDEEIANKVGLCNRQVVRIRQAFVQGKKGQSIEQMCERKPRPPAPERRRLDGKGEAKLVVIACSDPPDGRDSWTLQLLCDKLREHKVVESICPETVRKYLKKTNYSLGG